MSKTATIISMSAVKGGIGKSTFALNFGAYEARRNRRVLFIDMDDQCDTTTILGHHLKADSLKKSSIIRAFKHDAKDPMSKFPSDYQPAHVTKNIDLISGSEDIVHVGNLMQNEPQLVPKVLIHTIVALGLYKQYDYIILDTHNTFEAPTVNALLASDYILSPVTPNIFSEHAVSRMLKRFRILQGNFMDVSTGTTKLNAKLYFIGNMIENTSSSKQLLKQIKQINSIKQNKNKFIALFKKRELVNKSLNNFESVYSFATNSKDKKIIATEINPQFKKIDKIINK